MSAKLLIRALLAVVSLTVALGALLNPASVAAAPSLSLSGGILIEQSTGQRLYASNPGRELSIASTTKLMTALVTLEHARLNRTFAQNAYYPAAVDSQLGLVPGERMTVHDLLIALLLPSADDAAEDLAYNIGRGSVARFIAMMNARARQLGLTHTHYATPSGLDTPGNYSSASDLVKLAGYLLERHPFFARVVALQHAALNSGSRVRSVTNRNYLVGRVPWVTGIKTGHTLSAGYVLVGSGTRHGMTLLSAVLGASSESARDSDTLALLNYGFSHFRLSTPVRAGSILSRPAVRGQPHAHPELIAAAGLTRVVPRSARLTLRVQVPRELSGPLQRGAVVGHVVVLANDRPIGQIPLLLARALPRVSPLTKAARFSHPATLLALLALLGAATGVAVLVRERARGRSTAPLEAA